MKIDYETLVFIRTAMAFYVKEKTKEIAAEIYIHTKAGEKFEAENPGKEHGWFGWAHGLEAQMAKLLDQNKDAEEFLNQVDRRK